MFHSRKWLASCARLPRRDQEKVFTLRLRQPELDRRGVEPRFSGCKPDVVPLDQQPSIFDDSGLNQNHFRKNVVGGHGTANDCIIRALVHIAFQFGVP